MNMAILASGSGTNAQAILDRAAAGILDVNISLIVSNRPDAFVLERAQKAGIASRMLDHTLFPNRAAFDTELVGILRDTDAEYIILAGYMRLLTNIFLTAFENRVVNIHPALLPSFPGVHGGADAKDYGVKISGCTVHFVEEKMDSGPVIIQAAVPVNPEEQLDCLMQRIHRMEHRIYPQALQWLSEGRITRHGRQTVLKKEPRAQQCARGEDFFVWPPLEEGF